MNFLLNFVNFGENSREFAKILYSELFADLNLEAKVREFYAKFYDYDLSEDELELILNPK